MHKHIFYPNKNIRSVCAWGDVRTLQPTLIRSELNIMDIYSLLYYTYIYYYYLGLLMIWVYILYSVPDYILFDNPTGKKLTSTVN